ncbi:CFI-box-CTERM domain-containing protein [Chloroflexota bacterium]
MPGFNYIGNAGNPTRNRIGRLTLEEQVFLEELFMQSESVGLIWYEYANLYEFNQMEPQMVIDELWEWAKKREEIAARLDPGDACGFSSVPPKMVNIAERWESEVCSELSLALDTFLAITDFNKTFETPLHRIYAFRDMFVAVGAASNARNEIREQAERQKYLIIKERREEEEPNGDGSQDAEDFFKAVGEAAAEIMEGEGGITEGGSSPPVKEEPEEVKEEPKQPVVVERDTDDSSDDWCFIATAAYGTSTAQEIDVLRSFRDEFLRDSWLGNQFITAYNKYSPPIADYISERELLRAFVREVIIDPIVAVVDFTTDLWGE